MANSVFRKKSLERIASPEQLDDYLHVTTPMVWVVMAAVIILLVGLMAWGSVASLDSYAGGKGTVENKIMTIQFDDADLAENVQTGMKILTGNMEFTVSGIGYGSDGARFALADTDLPDGTYDVRVSYKQTQILKLLFH